MANPDDPEPREHEHVAADLAAVLAALEGAPTSAEQWELQGNIDGGEYSGVFQALCSIVEHQRDGVPDEVTTLLADVGHRLGIDETETTRVKPRWASGKTGPIPTPRDS